MRLKPSIYASHTETVTTTTLISRNRNNNNPVSILLHHLFLPLCLLAAATAMNNPNAITIVLGQTIIDFQNCNFCFLFYNKISKFKLLL
jgi:hypothetical protein